MGILSWLKAVATGEKHVPIEFADDERQFGSLDMKGAIDAHMAWKSRLEAQIAGNAGETLEVATVASDRNCLLGKWIHGEGRERFGDMDEYVRLRRAHTQFHLCAGAILKDAHDGSKESAVQAIRTNLRHDSDAVQLALVRLYAKARG